MLALPLTRQAKKAKEALAGKSFKAEVNIIPDAVHGFAVRGDQNNVRDRSLCPRC